jgi:Leucine-rich repeat (LRR) protein
MTVNVNPTKPNDVKNEHHSKQKPCRIVVKWDETIYKKTYDSFSPIIYLNCDNNRLTALPDHLPHSLKKLDFSYNDISQLPEKLNNYKILFT